MLFLALSTLGWMEFGYRAYIMMGMQRLWGWTLDHFPAISLLLPFTPLWSWKCWGFEKNGMRVSLLVMATVCHAVMHSYWIELLALRLCCHSHSDYWLGGGCMSVCVRVFALVYMDSVRVCVCLCRGNWLLLLCVGECKDYFGVNFWSVCTATIQTLPHTAELAQ